MKTYVSTAGAARILGVGAEAVRVMVRYGHLRPFARLDDGDGPRVYLRTDVRRLAAERARRGNGKRQARAK